jgi:hypothetical protein
LQLVDRVQKLRKALLVNESALHKAIKIEFEELWDDLLDLLHNYCPALFPAAVSEEVVETLADTQQSSRSSRSTNRNQQVLSSLNTCSLSVTALLA